VTRPPRGGRDGDRRGRAGAAGATVRRRRNVLARLGGSASLAEPIAVELRDGQVYRWREGP
jgi:hypothetical protein